MNQPIRETVELLQQDTTPEAFHNQYEANVKNLRKNKLDFLFVKRLFKILRITFTRITPTDIEKKISFTNVLVVFVLLGCCIGEIFLGNEVGTSAGAMSKAVFDSVESSTTSAATFKNALW
jgi:hypothetical protein